MKHNAPDYVSTSRRRAAILGRYGSLPRRRETPFAKLSWSTTELRQSLNEDEERSRGRGPPLIALAFAGRTTKQTQW